jgi:hypothetical protein
MTVQVQGLRRLSSTLKKAGDDLADLKDANAAAALLVASAAASRAPRRTGTLAASGRGNRAAGKAVVLFGGARAVYAPVVHYGWPRRGIRPQPFATDAARATEPQWLPIYEAAIVAVVAGIEGV